MCAASFGWCHLVNAYGVKSGWLCGWQVKLCDPVNTCHSAALRDCLGGKNALYKYLILYFTLFTSENSLQPPTNHNAVAEDVTATLLLLKSLTLVHDVFTTMT